MCVGERKMAVMQNVNEYIWSFIAICFKLHEQDAEIQEGDSLYLKIISESLIEQVSFIPSLNKYILQISSPLSPILQL